MTTLDDLLTRAGGERRLIGPLGFWHAAALEQIPAATMLKDPDAAARALSAAASLYGLDLVVAAPVDAVAWAVRGTAMPSASVAVTEAEHRAQRPVEAQPDVDAVASAAATRYLEAVVARLRSLSSAEVHTVVPIPTAESLAASLRPAVTTEWADEAIGTVLRTIGATEPDVILRIGEGPRAGLAMGLCEFFDIALVEVFSAGSPQVSGPTGEEFVGGVPAAGRLVTTRTELPSDADPKHVAEAVRSLRTKVER
ncbi:MULTISPECIES: hypothetical protein [Prauserella salsuginis group]|uniref:Uncharacterized protein n=1 Tax=Prauserella salsuginis TaxID=387889 RepID=A0ABW6G0R8_9PSEU|nr:MULTISPECIES: hypothetical protein [Prauserella salsuginis group]MCR3721950.1 hypothetical protein [Prauserella flava]MCR3735956.1 hypothetical protein [Prauserella salsuginis]